MGRAHLGPALSRSHAPSQQGDLGPTTPKSGGPWSIHPLVKATSIAGEAARRNCARAPSNEHTHRAHADALTHTCTHTGTRTHNHSHSAHTPTPTHTHLHARSQSTLSTLRAHAATLTPKQTHTRSAHSPTRSAHSATRRHTGAAHHGGDLACFLGRDALHVQGEAGRAGGARADLCVRVRLHE